MTKEKLTFKDIGVEWIGLELNNTCNIRCCFCPISRPELKRNTKDAFLDKNILFKVLEEIKRDGTLDHVVLNDYGEPFLSPYFEEVLKYCKNNGIRMRFATNGTLFNEDNTRLLLKYPPEELVVSIQYFYRKGYNEVKGTRIDREVWLDQIAAFIRVHMQEGLDTRVQLAVAGNYYNRLRNKVLGLRTGDRHLPYPDRNYFLKLKRFVEDFCENRLGLTFDPNSLERIRQNSYETFYRINSNIAFEVKSFFDPINNFQYFKENKRINCRTQYVIINARADVLMCCADYTGETAMGNVKNMSVKDVLLDNRELFENRNNAKTNIAMCRKCAGEPTFRGLIVRKAVTAYRSLIK